MPFIKHISKAVEYPGESFTKTLGKGNGGAWSDTEGANYEMFNSEATLVSSGGLAKSADDLTMTFTVPQADTAALDGNCLLLVYLTDTADPTMNDVIAEYHMEYRAKKPF